MLQQTVGREAELASGERFMDAVPESPRALVLEGEPGIGKTTLWRALVAAADARGFRVLSCRPAETEAKLAYSALSDLLREVVEETLRALPEPQRRALEIALLRTAPEGHAPDQRTVGTALLSVLELLAGRAPIVVAVDDVQWLDRASARVLEYALRRLGTQPLGILLCLRIEDERELRPPLALDRALSAERLQRLRLGPLSLAALHHVLVQQLGQHFARPALLRIEETSGGNPFFALELGRALLRAGEPTGHRLRLPQTLEELVLHRLRALPARTREALALAGASSQPSLRLLDSLGTEPHLGAAEAAGVVRVEGGRVSFAHPLLASGAYYAANDDERRRLHRRLAEAVSDPEERARHLALGATRPDADVAAGLEQAAALARARGAPDAAAELAEQARALTPPELPLEAARRAARVGEYLFEAGDNERARQVLEKAVAAMEPGESRARALLVLAWACYYGGAAAEAITCAEQAVAESATDALVCGQAHWSLAEFIAVSRDELRSSLEHAHVAIGLLTEHGDPELLAEATAFKLWAEVLLGRRVDPEEFKRLGAAGRASRLSPVGAPATFFLFMGDVEEARRLTEAALRNHREEGAEVHAAEDLAHLALVELAAGNWGLAEAHADEACRVVELSGRATPGSYPAAAKALVAAHLGRTEQARQLAEADVERGDSAAGLATLGFLALSEGDEREAARVLGRVVEKVGMRRARFQFDPDYVEALIASGDLERAKAELDLLEESARAIPRPWATATAARCGGLLAGARGDLTAALAALEQALVEHEALPMPFELGRTLLVKGQLHRRRGERLAANDTLTHALAIFESLPAPLWAEKARGELARVGLRRRGRDELTASELRVAQLAASGLTNREVAKAAFMSAKTVEANLSRAYRKLGIHTRAELGARMTELSGAPPHP